MRTSRTFTGIALPAFGGLLLLDRAGALAAGVVISAWWPSGATSGPVHQPVP